MEVLAADRLVVRVQDAEAVYPVRVDPTFSDADWVSLNPAIPGSNFLVYATAMDGSGNLYIGGQFNVAGSVAANNIAKWNGSVWSPLGTGMNYIVRALAVSGPNLYAGGDFSIAGGISASGVARWDGNSWSALGAGISVVHALAVNGSDLYAGGSFNWAGDGHGKSRREMERQRMVGAGLGNGQ